MLGAERGGELGTLLRPIATPLVMAASPGPCADIVADAFGASGFAHGRLPATQAQPPQAPSPATGRL